MPFLQRELWLQNLRGHQKNLINEDKYFNVICLKIKINCKKIHEQN